MTDPTKPYRDAGLQLYREAGGRMWWLADLRGWYAKIRPIDKPWRSRVIPWRELADYERMAQ